MVTNDKQDPVGSFLRAHKQEIKDNGFSRRVMHRLPDRYDRWALALQVTGYLGGIALFFHLDGWDIIGNFLHEYASALVNHEHSSTSFTMPLLAAGTLLALWGYNLYTREE